MSKKNKQESFKNKAEKTAFHSITKGATICAFMALLAIAGCANKPKPLPEVGSGNFEPIASIEWQQFVKKEEAKQKR